MESRGGGLIVTTAAQIEGRPVGEYLGIVSGESITQTSPGIGRSAAWFSRVRKKSHLPDQMFSAARERAVNEMTGRAIELGASAVLAVDIDVTLVQRTESGDIFMVTAVGTAVTL